MKKLTITTESEISAKGKLSSGHCKPIVCTDNGDTYSSMLDAAEMLGLCYPDLCKHLKGKSKHIRGMHFKYLEEIKGNPSIMISRVQQMAELEEKAAKWDALMAEQEAARKAEEKRIAELEKARAKKLRQQEMYERAMVKASEILAAMAETDIEIANLKGKEEEVA